MTHDEMIALIEADKRGDVVQGLDNRGWFAMPRGAPDEWNWLMEMRIRPAVAGGPKVRDFWLGYIRMPRETAPPAVCLYLTKEELVQSGVCFDEVVHAREVIE